jgi:hypothetical protein
LANYDAESPPVNFIPTHLILWSARNIGGSAVMKQICDESSELKEKEAYGCDDAEPDQSIRENDETAQLAIWAVRSGGE